MKIIDSKWDFYFHYGIIYCSQFLTINNADERAHLVPVLNTILKLSPDEANQLQTVARGGDNPSRGWSNILPMW